MSSKEDESLVKGWGAGLFLGIVLIAYLLNNFVTDMNLSTVIFWYVIAPGAILAYPLKNIAESPILSQFLIFIINLVIYFLIGSLIGWIVGKIKSRKAQN